MIAQQEVITHPLIIPTILIPLAAVSVGLSAVATYIAGLFGVTLKNEGPKKLLEVLLKPRVLVTAVLIQVLAMGSWKGYQYFKNYPAFIKTIQTQQKKLEVPSDFSYENAQLSSKRNFLEPQDSDFLKQSIVLKTRIQTHLSEQKTGAFVSAVRSAQSLFFGGDDGYIHELAYETGKERRRFFVGTMVTPGPVIFNGKLFAGEGAHDTHHARIYQFDLKTGEFLKSFQTHGHTEGNPQVLKNDGMSSLAMLFVPAGADGLYALDPETLSVLWHANEGHTDSGVVSAQGIVFNGTGREKRDSQKNKSFGVAYDFLTGKVLWKHELPASSWMTPLLMKEEVCFPFGEVYFKSEVGGFACFKQKSGEPSIYYHQGAPVISEMISIADDIILSDGFGKICRVSYQTGRAAWCTESGKDPKGKAFPGIIFDPFRNLLVYASKQDGFYVLNPKDGKVLNHWIPAPSEEPWGTVFASVLPTSQGYWVINDEGVLRQLEINLSHSETQKHAQDAR